MCRRPRQVCVRDENHEARACHLVALNLNPLSESRTSISADANTTSELVTAQQYESLPNDLLIELFRALGRIDSTHFYEAADQSIWYIEQTFKLIEENNFNRHTFVKEYYKKKNEGTLVILTTSFLFNIIWENLVNPVGPLFVDPHGGRLRKRLPNLYSWVKDVYRAGEDTPMRRQRNPNAHRAGVMVNTDWLDKELKRSEYHPGELFDRIQQWYPPLLEELREVCAVLEGRLKSSPIILFAPGEDRIAEVARAAELAEQMVANNPGVRFKWYRFRTRWIGRPMVASANWFINLARTWNETELNHIKKKEREWWEAHANPISPVVAVIANWDNNTRTTTTDPFIPASSDMSTKTKSCSTSSSIDGAVSSEKLLQLQLTLAMFDHQFYG
jgi:hypothetical protein